jgi:uncharacterized protein (TIGR00251 family)
VLVKVRVSPRSSQNKVEWVDGIVKVWVHAAPTDGEANEAVCRLIAKALNLTPSAVQLKSGHTGRQKSLEVEGITMEELKAKLNL